jgi:hypothetical protein
MATLATAATAPMGTGLTFVKMTALKIGSGFDITYALQNATLTAELCVGSEDNRVTITGTTPGTREAQVLAAIDTFGKWGEKIKLWMVGKKNGELVVRTAATDFQTHVKPYYGSLKISEIAKDDPAMTYPGNGFGRLLSEQINGRYYFKYAGKHETDNAKRGLDCTSFPMALFSLKSLPSPGYGKQLCDALGATKYVDPSGKSEYEQIKRSDLEKRLAENTTPGGYFVIFSEGHVLLYNGYMNVIHEFTHGGFKTTPGGSRAMIANNNLWWMRKLPDTVGSYFT